MYNLPLNIFLPTFSKSYLGYVNVCEKNNTDVVMSENWSLKSTRINNKSSLTADLSGNSIVFSPTIVDDSNNFWFIQDESGNYLPQKQLTTTLYQEIRTELNNNFSFAGNFQSITLQTKYDIPYTISAFIAVYSENSSRKLLLIDEINTPINTLGNFDIQLDASQLLNVTQLQWGFKITGYPVYPREAGNQGYVIITSVV